MAKDFGTWRCRTGHAGLEKSSAYFYLAFGLSLGCVKRGDNRNWVGNDCSEF